jgi:hypothetical protein
MSIITVEFDNTLTQSEITMPLLSSSPAESGNDNAQTATEKAQTAVFGIQTPLIQINSTIIDFDAVQYFELSSKGVLPELTITVQDRYELINNIDKPGLDNEVRIQILPKFDNAYKKINLTFYVSNIQINGNLIRLSCLYKLPMLVSSQYKSFGEIDTYNLFKTAAIDTGLGFATNISELSDNRFIYCDNKSLLDVMKSEIDYSNANEYILDWWVDLWNNINLVDVKERYNAIDPDDDLMIWVAGQVDEVGQDIENKPNKVIATLTTHPSLTNSELYVKSYSIQTNPGMSSTMGTDRVYGIYEDNNNEYIDYFIQDGDVKKDIFTKYAYIGENYGDYNYMLAKYLRKGYLQKITSENITVSLKSPLLALMRGHRVNFVRYVNDSRIENKLKNLENAGVINRNIESNIPLENYTIDTPSDNGQFIIDKTASGQYLIWDITIKYINNEWAYNLTLVKPASSKTSIVNEQ